MDPNEALKILDEATGRLEADRRTHAVIAEALRTLDKIVNIPPGVEMATPGNQEPPGKEPIKKKEQ
jgi:hypothetical protein